MISVELFAMRFIPDGPEIPNQLIRDWRAGKVLFLAGAGVSVPSGLPQFEELALRVYDTIGETMRATLQEARNHTSQSKREQIFDAASLSPDKRAEADLFLDKQFDRFFSALEKRIDPDNKGRAKTRNVRNGVDTNLSGRSHSDSHVDLLRLSMAPSSWGDPAIVTTNFDLLLEDAWVATFGSPALSYDARIAPRPGSRQFEGVVHLHGMLRAGLQESDYVLSSRDFARVYLRSGSIGNYVYDLIRRYKLVLIGYSADDPPMRYTRNTSPPSPSLTLPLATARAIGFSRARLARKRRTATSYRNAI